MLNIVQLNTQQAEWRYQFARAWHNTINQTGTGRPIDALICPCAPSASFPHGFPVWWGYFSLWNLLDYPSVVLPLKKMQVDLDKDAKNTSYVPRENIFDKMNWEICELSLLTRHRLFTDTFLVDDPERWKNQPLTLQIVRPQYSDEELIAVTECIDQVCNG